MTARSLCLLALTIGLCAPPVSAQQKKPATAPAGVAAPKGTALLVPAPIKRDPKIAAALAEVSADTMRKNLLKLVSFGTRHTMSDTLSQTRGIGAARRWIYSRF